MNLNLNFFFINLEFFNYFNLQYRQSSEFETWAEADDCLGHISTQLYNLFTFLRKASLVVCPLGWLPTYNANDETSWHLAEFR